MKAKGIFKKTLANAPKVGNYVKRKDELEKLVNSFDQQTEHLRHTIKALEVRNKQWEDEVRAMRGEAQSLEIVWPVSKEDLLNASRQKISNNPPPTFLSKNPPFIINWVMLPMGPVSGGHTDIFRIIRYLESKGHTCNIYFYDMFMNSSLAQIKRTMRNYPDVKGKIFYNEKEMVLCDAIFATSWHSAYPVFNYTNKAKKFYFVQDFEPYFDPVGSYSTLAENTYKLGLHGITLGNWLAEKLAGEYAMKCEPVDLGVDTDKYRLENNKRDKKILFYARPVTPRRGFELGVLALEEFHAQHPEYEINLVGWDISPYKIPFPYKNRGILNTEELNSLYNECIAGLVLSFTNMSLLPLEMMAAGCVPVINRAKHTERAKYKKYLAYTKPDPISIAQALSKAVSSPDHVGHSQKMAEYAQDFQWSNLYKGFEKILKRELS